MIRRGTCGKRKEDAELFYGRILRSGEGLVYKTPSNDDERFVNTHIETTSHSLHKTQWK